MTKKDIIKEESRKKGNTRKLKKRKQSQTNVEKEITNSQIIKRCRFHSKPKDVGFILNQKNKQKAKNIKEETRDKFK